MRDTGIDGHTEGPPGNTIAASQHSLSSVVALWTGVAIALSMAGYAVFEYLSAPGVTLLELIVNHLWHVAALGAAIYGLCWLVLRRLLIRPLEQIYLHLYGIGAGRLEELDLPTGVREIQTIVDGVNLMVRRMEQGLDRQAIERWHREMAGLRGLARQAFLRAPEEAQEILDRLMRLEHAFVSVIQSAKRAHLRQPAA
ncbi:MAG: hypothetical protein HY721_26325 [Planctomycetes bacterium]|nr:hypothetical protein [Planctomycetota bacterium]